MMAYLAHHFPMHAAKVALLTQENLPLSRQEPLRILDIGAGPLSASVGAVLTWERTAHVLALDRARAMMQLGAKTMSLLAPHVEVMLEAGNASAAPELMQRFQPHLVLAANVLGEVPNAASLAARLWDALPQDSHLLLLEPGTRIHSQNLIRIRETLRQQRDVTLLAPCLGQPACPLANTTDWCHTQRRVTWPQEYLELARRAGLNPEALKFSYLWLARTHVNPNPRDALRVIGGAMAPRPNVTLRYACGPSGRVTLEAHGHAARAHLEAVERGDLLNPLQAGLRTLREAAAHPTGRTPQPVPRRRS
jgi:precorrin-6B methylase 2